MKRIRLSDVEAMLRLVGECRELGDDPILWRQHLYGTVAKLVDADAVA